jgi:transmembrane sensor
MSDARSQEQLVAQGALNIRARAAAWLLKRRDHEHWGNDDQTALDAWLAKSPAHMIAYIRLEAAWSQADRLAALRGPSHTKISASPERTTFSVLSRVAVGLVVAIALSASTVLYFQRPREEIYATEVGAHRIVTLADGSQVELNTDTVLRATMDSKQRLIKLEKGEAYFQVRHDAAHPFVVMVGDRRVTDLGTKFLVRREPDRLEIAVIQGKVRLDVAGNERIQTRSMFLTPGVVAVVTAKSVFVTKKSPRMLANQLGWRHGVLVFENTTLADAAFEFNRYNNQKLIVAGTQAERMTIGGTFPAHNAEDFTRIVQSVLGLRVEKRGLETVISR